MAHNYSNMRALIRHRPSAIPVSERAATAGHGGAVTAAAAQHRPAPVSAASPSGARA